MGMPLLVTTRAPAPRRPSMPIEILDCSELTAHLDPTELGALVALCRAFWAGACRPMPTEDVGLMRLSGCDLRRWRLVRATVLAAFESLKAPLASVYAQSARTAEARAGIASMGGLTCAKNRRERAPLKVVKPLLTDDAAPGPLVPAKDLSTVNTAFDVNGTAIPKRVIRSNSAARLTEKA